jgi:hypothetical protein
MSYRHNGFFFVTINMSDLQCSHMSVHLDLHSFTSNEVTGPLLTNPLWQPTYKHFRNVSQFGASDMVMQFELWNAHIKYYTCQFRNSVASDV